jgi:hypothetical protein
LALRETTGRRSSVDVGYRLMTVARRVSRTWFAGAVAVTFLSGCGTVPSTGSPKANAAAVPSPSPALTPSPSATTIVTPIPSPTPIRSVHPASDYGIAPPYSLVPLDDPLEIPIDQARIVAELKTILGDPTLSISVGLRTIGGASTLPSFTVVRFPSGYLESGGGVDRIEGIRMWLCGGTTCSKLAAITDGGVVVEVLKNPCVGEIGVGTICYTAYYTHGDDLVVINSAATKPVRAARAFVTAIISATR